MIIDFHAHVLPGLDHGCTDTDTSILQLQMAKKAGIDIIVATSHFYPHLTSVEAFLAKRQESLEMLSEHLDSSFPRIVLGAEVLICEGIEKMDGLFELSIDGANAILLELPAKPLSNELYSTIRNLHRMYTGSIVLAHVERYDKDCIDSLFDLGLSGQINIDSLFRFNQRKKLTHWIEQGHIAALGSDLHGTAKAYPKFEKAKKRLNHEFDKIMTASDWLLNSAYQKA